jgi:hypothetical protein
MSHEDTEETMDTSVFAIMCIAGVTNIVVGVKEFIPHKMTFLRTNPATNALEEKAETRFGNIGIGIILVTVGVLLILTGAQKAGWIHVPGLT